MSEEATIKFGVPQGSILGPTLFLVYINDLCELKLDRGSVFTYADDTVLLFNSKSWADVEVRANKGLNDVAIWLRKNLLTVNVTKTKFMAFTLNSTSQPKSPLSLRIHCAKCTSFQQCPCIPLDCTNQIKYLGVIIDQHLTWTNHISALGGRIRKLIYTFKKLRHILPSETLMVVYYALAQSILSYCISIWGAAAVTHMLPLERAQRALLKVMHFKPRRYSTESLYKDTRVLTVRQLFIKAIILRQHAMTSEEQLKMNTHKRRKDVVFKLSLFRTRYARKSFLGQGPALYNRISKQTTIVNLNRNALNRCITNYLSQLNYTNTENLLRIID